MARLVFIICFFLVGCSFADSQRCRSLQSRGLVGGTLDSCTQCMGQLGPGNIDAINGCALGLDTARLIGGK